MEYLLNKTYHGFKLEKLTDVKDLNVKAYVFSHEKSGAKLLKLQSDDDNKSFSISFRTPPKDSTGVPHILEHSVLCGSRKFPLKDPFIELAKGSLNTFLNAMTFSDKTMYPVASRNKKDFMNLMDVYMDATLYPNIYKYPEILMQEGWHYELLDSSSPITYKGVVYNEMKGAYSSPETILFQRINESLYKDTTYSVESGGDPEYITDLTYEDFISFHKKYYHPSNSYIFLYGDGDLEEELSFLDENYLKDFNKEKVNSSIARQKPTGDMVYNTSGYSIAKDENLEDKTYLSLNYVVGDSCDSKLSLGFEILEYMLLETTSAPLKQALLSSGLGKDVFGMYDGSKIQPSFSIVLKNSNHKSKDAFKELVYKTLGELCKNGIDKELVEAAVNIKEFQLREGEFEGYPKGLVYNIKAMDSWLYDEDPLIHLNYDKDILEIKEEALNGRYFEEIIEKFILNSNHCSLVSIVPERGLTELAEEKTKKKLSLYKDSLKQEKIEELIKTTKDLKVRQEEGETPENLATIPLLSLEDIDKRTDFIKANEHKLEKGTFLYHPIFTSNIVYLNMYFDVSRIKEEDIPYLALLSPVLGAIDTENYSYSTLSNLININTGGMRFSLEPLSSAEDDRVFYPKLIIKSKSLVEKLPKLLSLITEILNNTKFTNEKRLKEILGELRSRMEMKILEHGHVVSAFRALSYLSPSANYLEETSGLSLYYFIRDLDDNFEEKKNIIAQKLKEILTLSTETMGVVVSATCEKEQEAHIHGEINDFLKAFHLKEEGLKQYPFVSLNKKEGLTTASKIQFVSKACNFRRLGYDYKGSMLVLKTICSLHYLWNNVRVLGGAYGCFMNIQRNGNMFFASYRDPNLLETIKVYDNISEFIGSFDIDEREMTKYIIGTISDMDVPLTPSMKGERGDLCYLKNITEEMLQRERDEVLGTKIEDIRAFETLLKDISKEDYLCVLGGEEKVSENKELFNTINSVFK